MGLKLLLLFAASQVVANAEKASDGFSVAKESRRDGSSGSEMKNGWWPFDDVSKDDKDLSSVAAALTGMGVVGGDDKSIKIAKDLLDKLNSQILETIGSVSSNDTAWMGALLDTAVDQGQWAKRWHTTIGKEGTGLVDQQKKVNTALEAWRLCARGIDNSTNHKLAQRVDIECTGMDAEKSYTYVVPDEYLKDGSLECDFETFKVVDTQMDCDFFEDQLSQDSDSKFHSNQIAFKAQQTDCEAATILLNDGLASCKVLEDDLRATQATVTKLQAKRDNGLCGFQNRMMSKCEAQGAFDEEMASAKAATQERLNEFKATFLLKCLLTNFVEAGEGGRCWDRNAQKLCRDEAAAEETLFSEGGEHMLDELNKRRGVLAAANEPGDFNCETKQFTFNDMQTMSRQDSADKDSNFVAGGVEGVLTYQADKDGVLDPAVC